ncbi:MAG: YkvA family protein [Proteobacteria bacterium]|nr:YkvA family protein [Pseudomonadota bacterium]
MQRKALKLYESKIDEVRPGDEEKIRKRFPKAIARLPDRSTGVGWIDGMVEQVKLLYEMLFDPEFVMMWETKAAIIAALEYFISPRDAVPDSIPVVGWADDALVVMFAIHSVSGDIARYAALKRKQKAKARTRQAKPAAKKHAAKKPAAKKHAGSARRP